MRLGFEVEAALEWKAFFACHANDAADAVAAFEGICAYGESEIRDEDDNRTGIPDLYCRECGGWGMFYTVSATVRGEYAVTVRLVAEFRLMPMEQAKREAVRRWRGAGVSNQGVTT